MRRRLVGMALAGAAVVVIVLCWGLPARLRESRIELPKTQWTTIVKFASGLSGRCTWSFTGATRYEDRWWFLDRRRLAEANLSLELANQTDAPVTVTEITPLLGVSGPHGETRTLHPEKCSTKGMPMVNIAPGEKTTIDIRAWFPVLSIGGPERMSLTFAVKASPESPPPPRTE